MLERLASALVAVPMAQLYADALVERDISHLRVMATRNFIEQVWDQVRSPEIAAGLPLKDVACRTHPTKITYTNDREARLTTDPLDDTAANRDFICSYRLTGGAIQSGLLLTEGTDMFGTQFSPAELALVVRRGHEAGLPVVAHAHSLAELQAFRVAAQSGHGADDLVPLSDDLGQGRHGKIRRAHEDDAQTHATSAAFLPMRIIQAALSRRAALAKRLVTRSRFSRER